MSHAVCVDVRPLYVVVKLVMEHQWSIKCTKKFGRRRGVVGGYTHRRVCRSAQGQAARPFVLVVPARIANAVCATREGAPGDVGSWRPAGRHHLLWLLPRYPVRQPAATRNHQLLASRRPAGPTIDSVATNCPRARWLTVLKERRGLVILIAGYPRTTCITLIPLSVA